MKRAIEQLSSDSGAGQSARQSGPSKRPSIAAHLSVGTVAQRLAQYSAAVAADQLGPSSPAIDMPRASSAVAELIEQFSPVKKTEPDIQHTQRDWTPQSARTQTEPQAQPDTTDNSNNSQQKHDSQGEYSGRVQVGHVVRPADGLTGTLHSQSAERAVPSSELATQSALSTADVQPQQSTLVEQGTAARTALATPLSSKQARKQRRAQASRVEPPAQSVSIAGPLDKQALSTPPSIAAQPVGPSASTQPSERFVMLALSPLWHAALCCVWTALLLCAVDLFAREATLESAILSGLSAAATIANVVQLVRARRPSTASRSAAVVKGLTAIAASALPFLFAQRLGARSTMYVGQQRTARPSFTLSSAAHTAFYRSLRPSISVVIRVCVCLSVCLVAVVVLSPSRRAAAVSVPASLLCHSAVCVSRGWQRGASQRRSAVVSVRSPQQCGLPALPRLLSRSAACQHCAVLSAILDSVAAAPFSARVPRSAYSAAAGSEYGQLAAHERLVPAWTLYERSVSATHRAASQAVTRRQQPCLKALIVVSLAYGVPI